MKKIILSLLLLTLLAACNVASEEESATNSDTSMTTTTTTPAGPADTAQARRDLTALLDSLHQSFTRRDAGYIDRYMTEDGLYMGTDPTEILTRAEFRNYQDTALKNPSFNPRLDVRERIIRIHGASANLVEQYMAPGLSQKVMLRNVAHARYENGRWLIDMLTYNVIPKNEDFPKLERAL